MRRYCNPPRHLAQYLEHDLQMRRFALRKIHARMFRRPQFAHEAITFDQRVYSGAHVANEQ